MFSDAAGREGYTKWARKYGALRLVELEGGSGPPKLFTPPPASRPWVKAGMGRAVAGKDVVRITAAP
jgi:hypothetical protein